MAVSPPLPGVCELQHWIILPNLKSQSECLSAAIYKTQPTHCQSVELNNLCRTSARGDLACKYHLLRSAGDRNELQKGICLSYRIVLETRVGAIQGIVNAFAIICCLSEICRLSKSFICSSWSGHHAGSCCDSGPCDPCVSRRRGFQMTRLRRQRDIASDGHQHTLGDVVGHIPHVERQAPAGQPVARRSEQRKYIVAFGACARLAPADKDSSTMLCARAGRADDCHIDTVGVHEQAQATKSVNVAVPVLDD